MKTFPTIYKWTKLGKVQSWTIEVDGNRYRSTSGDPDGSLVQSAWTDCRDHAHALASAESKLAHKRKARGYVDTLPTNPKTATAISNECQTAKVFADYAHRITFPCWAQPKLDGKRLEVQKDGIWSREHTLCKQYPFLERAYAKLLKAEPKIVPDGEAYNHEFKARFEDLMSLCAKTKNPTPEMEKFIQHHVYDVAGSFGTMTEDNQHHERMEAFAALVRRLQLPDCIKVVLPVKCHSQSDLDILHRKWVAEGYEGSMIRWGSTRYEHGRTHFMLKRKDFVDGEFPIVGIEEGTGALAGCVGSFVFAHPNGQLFRAKKDSANLDEEKCTAYLRRCWTDHRLWKGRMATVKYRSLTGANGVPKNSTVKIILTPTESADWKRLVASASGEANRIGNGRAVAYIQGVEGNTRDTKPKPENQNMKTNKNQTSKHSPKNAKTSKAPKAAKVSTERSAAAKKAWVTIRANKAAASKTAKKAVATAKANGKGGSPSKAKRS